MSTWAERLSTELLHTPKRERVDFDFNFDFEMKEFWAKRDNEQLRRECCV
jgi:hypothetical protein